MSTPAPIPAYQREKRSVAFYSLLAAAVMCLLKLAAGLFTRSLGLLSEAAHSGLDLLAGLLTLLSIRVSDKPADDDHPYGHGKIENVSAYTQTFLMLLSAAWITYEAIHRLLHRRGPHDLTLWAFAVMPLSIIVDITRSRALGRMAKKHGSPALAADALHFRTDIWTSSAVLVGLACAWLAPRVGLPWLAYADSIAALIVAAVIMRIAYGLARPTVDELLDAVPEQERLRLLDALRSVPSVLGVERLRLRRSGARYYADLTLAMSRTLTFQRSEQLVADVTAAVQSVLPDCDVVVHTVPRASRAESIFDCIRAVASAHNLSVHDLSVQDDNGSLHAEQHLELPENMSLSEAHAFVSALEQEILRETPGLGSILTHIEAEPASIEHNQSLDDTRLERLLRAAAAEDPLILDIHDVRIRNTAGHIHVTCHCTLSDNLSMARVHEVITALEGRFKLAAPEVGRLFIHPEPATDNRR
jgi:cation diffusion facilitator family transporter